MCNNNEEDTVHIFWCLLFKITSTAHHSYTFRVIYSSIQYLSIIKSIMMIKKYLDISIYLDNCTPLCAIMEKVLSR